MKTVSAEIQDISIKSLDSIFHKLSSACQSMSEKGAHTTLVKKRQSAVAVGLESLRGKWHGAEFPYDNDVISSSQEVLKAIVPSIERQIERAQDSSSQKNTNRTPLNSV